MAAIRGRKLFINVPHRGRVVRNSQLLKWRLVPILFYRFRDLKVEKSYLDARKAGKLVVRIGCKQKCFKHVQQA